MDIIETLIAIDWVHWFDVATSIIGSASILLAVIPQLDKDHKLKPILSFIGRFIALNKPLFEKKK